MTTGGGWAFERRKAERKTKVKTRTLRPEGCGTQYPRVCHPSTQHPLALKDGPRAQISDWTIHDRLLHTEA